MCADFGWAGGGQKKTKMRREVMFVFARVFITCATRQTAPHSSVESNNLIKYLLFFSSNIYSDYKK